MSKRFFLFWVVTTAILFLVVVFGLAVLSQMALSPNGNVPSVPWPRVLGAGVGLAAYWSAACWALALLRRKPLVATGIVAVTALVAFGYPGWDQAQYRKQQDAAVQSGLIGIPPDWTNKTALLIWPGSDECMYDCWNLALNMEARVILLLGQAARDVDFGEPVDLTGLPLMELVREDGGTEPETLQPVEAGTPIDFVIIHHEQAIDFDDVFDDIRPPGIPRTGLQIDAMIVPVPDLEHFDIGQVSPVLRLSHVSRNIAETPFVPFNGRHLLWNARDRDANDEVAKSYFCSDSARDPHWCYNAFD